MDPGTSMSEIPAGKTAKELILEVLSKADRPLRVKEIQEMTGLNYNTIRGRLQELKKAGLVERQGDGWVLVKKQQ